MKKKSDFITNSSSCSFVAWGITIDENELKEKCGRNLFKLKKERDEKKKDEKAKSNGSFMSIKIAQNEDDFEKEYLEYIDDGDFVWDISSILGEGIRAEKMEYEDEVMIGKSPFSIKDDQTKLEYKQEICDTLNKIGLDLKPSDLSEIEECWMNN